MAQLRSLLGLSNPSLAELNRGTPTLQPGDSITAGYYSGGSVALYPHGSQQFTSNGTFTVPSNVTEITVMAIGGGGSGGVQQQDTTGTEFAFGGNSGTLIIYTLSVSPGISYTVSIGAGGAAVTSSSTTSGNAGGSTSFGSILTAAGGAGGVAGTSGPASDNGSSTVPSGAVSTYSYGLEIYQQGPSAIVPNGAGGNGVGGFGGGGAAAYGGGGNSVSSNAGQPGAIWVYW